MKMNLSKTFLTILLLFTIICAIGIVSATSVNDNTTVDMNCSYDNQQGNNISIDDNASEKILKNNESESEVKSNINDVYNLNTKLNDTTNNTQWEKIKGLGILVKGIEKGIDFTIDKGIEFLEKWVTKVEKCMDKGIDLDKGIEFLEKWVPKVTEGFKCVSKLPEIFKKLGNND